jgi:sporulation protein YlmC with PRC-barrel domain
VTLEGFGIVTGTWSQVTNVADKTTFTAKGNYTGTIGNVACNMQAKEIADATVGAFAAMTYTGEAQTPVAKVTLEGYGTVTGTWSQVTNVADKTTFTANGNYTGTIGNVACNMQAKEIADATVGTFAAMTYTGEAQTPVAEVTLEGFGIVTGTWSEVTNVADKATFTANGNYTGTLRTSTGMAPKTIAVLSASIADVAYDTNGNYTFVVTDVVFDTEELSAADYTTTTQLVGENAEGATSEVLITFNMINSNYAFAANTLTATVNLLKHEHEWSYSAEGATIYATCNDTNANCPTPTATITLQAPLDATYSGTAKRVTLAGNYPGLANLEEFITYEGDCTSVGTHTATLNYQGVVATLEFAILPKDMTDEVVVKGIADSYEFTGELIEPSITVMVGDTALVEGQDYTVAISDNLEAGVGSVVITFTGNYSGSTTITFTIIDTTIEAIMHGEHIVCYDLNGRRILEPLKGEIYIINGKKVRW